MRIERMRLAAAINRRRNRISVAYGAYADADAAQVVD